MQFVTEENKGRIKAKFALAETQKNGIWDLITKAMQYTLPNESSTQDDGEITVSDGTKGIFDSTAILESSKLSKKLSNMIFPPQVQYGGLVANGNENKNVQDTIRKYGEEVFSMLDKSNFNKETLNYLQNWSSLGTGALRIIETGDVNMPFRFKQLSISNLYFAEDGYGRPNYVFYKNTNMTNDQIEQVWGEKFESKEDDEAITVMESVFFEKTVGLDGVFHYIVSDEELNEIIKEETFDYNPFIVTRYKRFSNGNYWGLGEAMNCLSNIVNINSNKKISRILAIQLATPSYLGYGDKGFISRIKLRLGRVTYMGTSNENGLVLPPQGNGNLELSIIEKDELVIKQTFYSDFMNGVSDSSGVRSAYEWQLRNQEFLNVFSPNYSMFEEEGLIPIFTSCFKILTKLEIGIIDKKVVEKLDIQPTFKNRLTDNSNFEKIQKFNRYLQNSVQDFGVPITMMSVNVDLAIEMLSIWYEVEPSLIKGKDEYSELLGKYIESLIGSQMPQQEQQAPQQGGMM